LTAGTRLKFWGVRGSIPTPGPATVHYGGNTSCIEVRVGAQIIILDAGTGLRLLGRQLMSEFKEQPLDLTLLLTHTHWDHIQGLPFFLPIYQPRNRLHILGYEGARHGLDNILTEQMESPFFPIGLREVPANVNVQELKDPTFKIGSVEVNALRANHPGNCVGYRLNTPSGSIAFFPDNETYPTGLAPGAPASEADQAASQKLKSFLNGVDVLIMDAQYDREEYRSHEGWGHGCVDAVVELAASANIKNLFLFHHDPEHDDSTITQIAEHGRALAHKLKSPMKVYAAREGETVEL